MISFESFYLFDVSGKLVFSKNDIDRSYIATDLSQRAQNTVFVMRCTMKLLISYRQHLIPVHTHNIELFKRQCALKYLSYNTHVPQICIKTMKLKAMMTILVV